MLMKHRKLQNQHKENKIHRTPNRALIIHTKINLKRNPSVNSNEGVRTPQNILFLTNPVFLSLSYLFEIFYNKKN